MTPRSRRLRFVCSQVRVEVAALLGLAAVVMTSLVLLSGCQSSGEVSEAGLEPSQDAGTNEGLDGTLPRIRMSGPFVVPLLTLEASLTTDKTTYAAPATAWVTYNGFPADPGSWMTATPVAPTNPVLEGVAKSLFGATSGNIEIGRMPPGAYVIQAFDTESNLIAESDPIEVEDGPLPLKIVTDHLVYPLGSSVTVSFWDAPGYYLDWIGIHPYGATADNYVERVGTSGAIADSSTFSGIQSGKYVARYYENQTDKLLAESQPFRVGSVVDETPTPTVTMAKGVYMTSEPIVVTYAGVSEPMDHDWVGFSWPGEPAEMAFPGAYAYTHAQSSGQALFPPNTLTSGTYVARVYSDDSFTLVAESTPFSVMSAGPEVCGDGERTLDEECDDGNETASDACDACVVRDFLAIPATTPPGAVLPEGRYFGEGRHPISVSATTMASVFMVPDGNEVNVAAATFDINGVPLSVDGASLGPNFDANPVIAALPGGKFAIAWTAHDMADERDVVIAAMGIDVGLRLANTTTGFDQYGPDILWTGSEIVVAWVDASNLDTGPDIKFRRFNSSFSPIGPEETLAATPAIEGRVSLASYKNGWAAAWRAGTEEGEFLRVKASTGETWELGPLAAGPEDDVPALAQVDADRLALVFTESVDPDDTGVPLLSRLRVAILDPASSEPPTSYPLPGGSDPPGDDSLVSQSQPAAVVSNGQLYIAWRSSRLMSDPDGDELWMKEISLPLPSGSGALASPTHWTMNEYTLPRSPSHRAGDQRRPALASILPESVPPGASGALPGSPLIAAWNDYGQTLALGQGKRDVVLQFAPTPILRLTAEESP